MNRRTNTIYKVRAFNSVENAYLDLMEPFVDTKGFVTTGRPHKELCLRPRELFGLILMSHVMHFLDGGKWVPGTDPFGHDGSVTRVDDPKRSGKGYVYEQVFVPMVDKEHPLQTLEEAVLHAIKKKSDRGEEYRSSTELIVFLHRSGMIGNLRDLADLAGQFGYNSVYMISHMDKMDAKDELNYMCVILKHPAYVRGPLSISIDRKNGIGYVERIMS